MENNNQRITMLDGFRTIAILTVMLYHFFSRYISTPGHPSLYPYGSEFNFFEHGYLGVHFFFVISGFVIFYTLERTKNLLEFWKHRLIRLWPTILIASLLTYLFLKWFDAGNSFPEGHEVKNLFMSITFLPPSLGRNHFQYLNGSYWSLWPELQFYFFASLLFYSGNERFIERFGIVSALLILMNHLIRNIKGTNTFHLHLPDVVLTGHSLWFEQRFNLLTYLPFFCAGVFFYKLYQYHCSNRAAHWFIKTGLLFFILFSIYSGIQMEIRLIYVTIYLLFTTFIYYPRLLTFLQARIWVRIGMSSYFLYLIHEDIGVVMIRKIGPYLAKASFVPPVAVMAGLILISILYTEKIEKKLIGWFRGK